MVLSYHEFLAAGSVSRFPSGQQAAGHRPLAKAFKKQKVDQSPERMERLKKNVVRKQNGTADAGFSGTEGIENYFRKDELLRLFFS